jgi:hypothetical protein
MDSIKKNEPISVFKILILIFAVLLMGVGIFLAAGSSPSPQTSDIRQDSSGIPNQERKLSDTIKKTDTFHIHDTINQSYKRKSSEGPIIKIDGEPKNPSPEVFRFPKSDSFRFMYMFANYGDPATGFSIHYALIQFRPGIRAILTDKGAYKTMPGQEITKDGQSWIVQYMDTHIPNITRQDTFYYYMTYCFKDLKGKKYGPYFSIRKYVLGNVGSGLEWVSEKEYSIVKDSLQSRGHWFQKYFD